MKDVCLEGRHEERESEPTVAAGPSTNQMSQCGVSSFVVCCVVCVVTVCRHLRAHWLSPPALQKHPYPARAFDAVTIYLCPPS